MTSALPLLLLLTLALPGTVAAQEAFAGSWRIAESADLSGRTDTAAALVGATLRFEADEVAGPHPLGCGNTFYTIFDLPPLGLFQGTLRPEEADAVAERLGLLPQAETLRVDCDSGTFDYHAAGSAAGPPRLLIMLDNRILTLFRTE